MIPPLRHRVPGHLDADAHVGAGQTSAEPDGLVVPVHARSGRHLVRVLGDEAAEVTADLEDVGGVVEDVDACDEISAGGVEVVAVVDDVDLAHGPEVARHLELGRLHDAAAVRFHVVALFSLVGRVAGAVEIVV
jgi:hypothetical protein